MAKERKWYVESKVFEMLIKGGNAGLRIVERSKRKQGSIFLRRDELAWVVGAVEEVLDVDTTEVFWDPGSAGFPRVLVQRRSNRHGGFIIMEEFEGSSRRGSILIPEGRYGQGWVRLLSELRIARRTVWEDRVFKENKAMQLVTGRSYAEVVGRPKTPEIVPNESPAVAGVGVTPAMSGGDRAVTHAQRRPVSNILKVDDQFGAAGGGSGVAPEKTKFQAQEEGHDCNNLNFLSKSLQNPGRGGVAESKEGNVSEKNGQEIVLSCVDLQDIKSCLVDIRSQLVLGMQRVERAFLLLDMKERVDGMGKAGDMGCGASKLRASQSLGREGTGWAKPKNKNFKGIKNQLGLLGPKPTIQTAKGPGDKNVNPAGSKSCKNPAQEQASGPMKTRHVPKPGITPAQPQQVPDSTKLDQYRRPSRQPVQRWSQTGESSKMGAATVDYGSLVAGDLSGEQLEGGGVLLSGGLGSCRCAEMSGEPNVEIGRREESSTQRSVSISERAEGLGDEFSAPLSLISMIPESVNRGKKCGSPVKSTKRLSDYSETADEVGMDSHTPEKQSKLMKVFQRRESPSAKIMKSWVAERVSWIGGRDCVVTTEVDQGKDHDICLDTEVQTVFVNSGLDDPDELGCVGGMGTQEKDRHGIEGCASQLEEELLIEELLDQGTDLEPPAVKYMKSAWAVKGIAGLTCDGQEGKLEEVFGQIVADKFGGGAAAPAGAIADDNMGTRDEDFSYEA
jgi:hypothetical protein